MPTGRPCERSPTGRDGRYIDGIRPACAGNLAVMPGFVSSRRVRVPQRRYARGLAARALTDARLSDAPRPAPDPESPPWPGQYVDVAGEQLYVRRTPPGRPGLEPALLVHGLGGSSLNWTDLAQQLSDELDVHALDLPGFGRSHPNRSRDYSVRAHADAVIGYIETSQRGPVHLIGNSMGGATALEVAVRRPDLVRTLTVISPAVPDTKLRVYAVRHNPRMAVMVVPGLAAPLVRRATNTAAPEAIVRTTIKLCFGDPSRYPAARLAQDVESARERLTRPWAAEALVRSGRDLARFGLRASGIWRQYGQIDIPTLVVWGDHDRLVSPELAPVLAGVLPDARLLMIEGVGHCAMMEMPELTARAVLALVEDSGAGPADEAESTPSSRDESDTRSSAPGVSG